MIPGEIRYIIPAMHIVNHVHIPALAYVLINYINHGITLINTCMIPAYLTHTVCKMVRFHTTWIHAYVDVHTWIHTYVDTCTWIHTYIRRCPLPGREKDAQALPL